MTKIFQSIKNTVKDMDKTLLFFMILLSDFGLFNVVTASSREAVTNTDYSVFYYFYRHIIILVASYIGFIILLKIDTKKYHWLIGLAYIAIVVLNLYVIVYGNLTRGASNWIDLGFFKLQPSELAKPVIIVAFAIYMERFAKKMRSPKIDHNRYIWGLLFLGLIIPSLVFVQKDAGTMIIQLMIVGVMYLLSPIITKEKWKYIGYASVIVLILGLLIYSIQGFLLSDAQLSRLNYFNPCSNYADNGYQVCNAYIAINLGGLKGVGIGKSTQKYSYIPEPHTDMVFAILSEEYGFIIGALIIIIYAVMIYRILMLSSRANTVRGKYICLGVATYIMAHITINLGGLFGLIPLTGVPLPFLSYGGSFTISLIAALALVQRVHIETSRYKLKF